MEGRILKVNQTFFEIILQVFHIRFLLLFRRRTFLHYLSFLFKIFQGQSFEVLVNDIFTQLIDDVFDILGHFRFLILEFIRNWNVLRSRNNCGLSLYIANWFIAFSYGLGSISSHLIKSRSSYNFELIEILLGIERFPEKFLIRLNILIFLLIVVFVFLFRFLLLKGRFKINRTLAICNIT